MHLSETPPPYCCSCHSDCVGKDTVDFDAYYDGPVLEEEHYKYQVDDLVICKDCLLQAGKLIGIGDVNEFKQENSELGEALDVKLGEILELHKVISGLENAVEGLSSEKIMKPQKRGPKQMKAKLVEVESV